MERAGGYKCILQLIQLEIASIQLLIRKPRACPVSSGTSRDHIMIQKYFELNVDASTPFKMARFTSIGMPKKTFVASAAEETLPDHRDEAGPSNANAEEAGKKKRKRSKSGKGDNGVQAEAEERPESTPNRNGSGEVQRSWGRDENIASESALG